MYMSLFQRNETDDDHLQTGQLYFSKELLFTHEAYDLKSHACTLLGHPLTRSNIFKSLLVLQIARLRRC